MKVFAQGINNPVLPSGLGGSAASGTVVIGKLISSIAGFLFLAAAILTFLYLVVGGLDWITSGGDKSKLEGARNKITNAILGLLIVASAWAVWLLIGKFLGISTESLPFPTLG